MAARGAQAGLFEVLRPRLRAGGLSATPERGTNLDLGDQRPGEMRDIVSGSQRQAWTYTTMRYTDGREVPGFVVGAPLAVRGVGPYELYQLFPLDTEQETLTLVRNATAVAGLLIILGLAGLAALVTFMIVSPVHEAARTARRFSSGHLEARMRVRGQDDLAQLAVSFNEMAGTLQSQIDELEKLSSVQQQFVADVSHELRTPLTTVRMAADLLHDKRQELPGRRRPGGGAAAEPAQPVRGPAGRPAGDLAAGRRVGPPGLRGGGPAGDVPSGWRPLWNRWPTELGSPVEVIGLDSLVVPCDALRVERILANLISNALEHGDGPAGGGGGHAARGRGPGGVTDQGVGLTQQELTNVFTRFWRADPSRVRRVGGTGLGLSIALGDARAHGGDAVGVRGAPGRARPSRCGCRWRLGVARTAHGRSASAGRPSPGRPGGARAWMALVAAAAGLLRPAPGCPRRAPSSRGRSWTRGSHRSSSGSSQPHRASVRARPRSCAGSSRPMPASSPTTPSPGAT